MWSEDKLYGYWVKQVFEIKVVKNTRLSGKKYNHHKILDVFRRTIHMKLSERSSNWMGGKKMESIQNVGEGRYFFKFLRTISARVSIEVLSHAKFWFHLIHAILNDKSIPKS